MNSHAKVMIASIGVATLLGCSTSPSADAVDAAVGTSDSMAEDAHPEAAPDCGAGLCAPGCIADYAPLWRPPHATQGKCTDSDLDEFVQLGGAFAAFQTAHPDCFTCLVSDDTATILGAFLIHKLPSILTGNLAGCIALRDADVSATGCGAETQARIDCEYVACADNCPVSSKPELDALNACLTDAQGSVCASYAAASASCKTDAECFPSTYVSNADWFRYLGGLFCGGLSSDAGEGG